MSEILQAKTAREKLEGLREKLNEISESKARGVNVFDAVGMQTQEIKHSAFFAWLLDRNRPHGLGTLFLEKFLRELIIHPNSDNEELRPESNREILRAAGIDSVTDLSGFLADARLNVQTEKVLHSQENRMDIFLESQETKTVAVIENKVFTSTHGNQLLRYEEELKDRVGWKKIFVYLTPNGSAPYDFEEYRKNWCVFSYKTIVKICRELLKELPNKKENARLKMLLEDYTEMVDTNVLKGNQELKQLCRQIRREHRDALELLLAYTDNAEEAVAFCRQLLLANSAGFKPHKEGKASLQFYTPSAELYFSANGEPFMTETKRLKLRYFITSAKGAVEAGIALEKEREKPWSAAQAKILSAAAPGKAAGELYCTLFSTELLSEEDREKDFESVRNALELRLNGFIGSIEEFELKYLR